MGHVYPARCPWDRNGAGPGAAVIEAAADTVEELRLTVVASNATAVRLYARCGFREYGVEPRALKIGDRYHDEVLMALPLRKSD